MDYLPLKIKQKIQKTCQREIENQTKNTDNKKF